MKRVVKQSLRAGSVSELGIRQLMTSQNTVPHFPSSGLQGKSLLFHPYQLFSWQCPQLSSFFFSWSMPAIPGSNVGNLFLFSTTPELLCKILYVTPPLTSTHDLINVLGGGRAATDFIVSRWFGVSGSGLSGSLRLSTVSRWLNYSHCLIEKCPQRGIIQPARWEWESGTKNILYCSWVGFPKAF